MGDGTRIEWTDATWNPVTGCTKVTAGCDHCYAETIAHRFAGTPAYPHGFDVTLRPERLVQPLRWTKPRRVFVNSMSDLFHKDVPDEFIARVWAVMALAPRHTFQILTKRHGRMRALLDDPAFRQNVWDAMRARYRERVKAIPGPHPSPELTLPLPNVWLGVSVENQQTANMRIPALMETPAAVRWVSCEPLLGPLDLRLAETTTECTCSPYYGAHERHCGIEPGEWSDLDWVVVGGESGTGARPMHPEWARSLRDQCQRAGVPFLFKQWGEWAVTGIPSRSAAWVFLDGTVESFKAGDLSADVLMRRVGKKAAGRHLDGRTWDEYPS